MLCKCIKIITDVNGYLINPKEWNEKIAIDLACLEDIKLIDAHWQVIYFMRSFYFKYNTSPTIRMLVKAMIQKYGKEKNNSKYLFKLFPYGPAKQATKISGLPKPVICL